MEIRGKIIDVLPAESGVSKVGKDWHRQEFVIETIEQFPKKVALHIFGEAKVDQFSYYRKGQEIICQIKPESREFKGRWYTQVYVWNFHGVENNRG